MNKLILVDYSTMAHRCWHSMKGPGHICKVNSEKVEFHRALALAAYSLRARFPDEDILFCMDSLKNWRQAEWKRWYRAKVFSSAYSTPDGMLYWRKDGYWWTTQVSEKGLESVPWKLLKAASDQLEAGGYVPGQFDKTFAPILDKYLGAYKGSRRYSEWDYSTDKATFKDWIRLSGPCVAGIIGAGVAILDGCEADDIIACAVRNCPEGMTAIVVSTDQDISSSEGKGPGQLMDMSWVVNSWDQPALKPISRQVVVENAVAKILKGDPGDDIGPCLTRSGKRVTEKNIAGYLTAFRVEGNGPDVVDLDISTWDRNMNLMWLRDEGAHDEDILEVLGSAYDNAKEVPFGAWNITETDRLMAQSEGRRNQGFDREAGLV